MDNNRLAFQSTRPIRGATPCGGSSTLLSEMISIHAPHTGRDTAKNTDCTADKQFQSTRPIRGATKGRITTIVQSPNFNPRAPYGARLRTICFAMTSTHFNPRAPYGARPAAVLLFGRRFLKFQSTRPIRGATNRLAHNMLCNNISIHAPHTGRDPP